MIKNFNLNTIKNEFNQQRQLFDFSPKLAEFKKAKAENSFIDEGYLLINNIRNELDAINVSYHILTCLREKPLFYSEFLEQVQLSKADLIPVCEPFVEGGFQALHFDYGLPLIPTNDSQNESFDMFLALYCPFTSKNITTAATRIVNLRDLRLKGDYIAEEIESRIDNYIERYGDGWLFPEPYNSKRISIFARILDAAMDLKQFTAKIEAHSQNFFLPEANLDKWQLPNKQLEMEYKYYSGAGIDLNRTEIKITLRPGQLLIIDNIRTVHGRLGFRRPREIWQFLFGLKKSPPTLINQTKEFIVKSLVSYT